MSSGFENLESFYYLIGLLVMGAYAWQRFDEPSFPNRETLPQVVEPLRYLFLGPTYRRAQLTYLFLSLLLYSLLVLPGPGIVAALRPFGATEANFPVQVWALMVALLLVGFVPNTNIQWLTMIEARLRHFVHSFFLVPDGTLRTIAVLEDTRYSPPVWLTEAIESARSGRLLADMRLGPDQPEYRWARATLLFESLKQRGNEANPLKRGAFAPFEKDFEGIRRTYKSLEVQLERLRSNGVGERPPPDAAQPLYADANDLNSRREELAQVIGQLLRQMYAYLNWGIRQQASSEKDVAQILEDIGFNVPVVRNQRSLFDVVLPTTLLVAFWSFGWAILIVSVIPWTRTHDPISKILVVALTSGTASGCMYGFAIYNALHRRSVKIEDRIWVQWSPRCFVAIALVAGLVSWFIIVASTIFWHAGASMASIIGIWSLIRSLGLQTDQVWPFLPTKILTALPWFVAGGTASVIVAYLLGGDVRRADWKTRLRDGFVLGGALGIAAAFAQGIQLSLIDLLQPTATLTDASLLTNSITQGLGEFVIGVIIGLVVPLAFRRRIVTPTDAENARALRKISERARNAIGNAPAATDWVFNPSDDLGGISPAEAIQYETLVNRVSRLLDGDSPHLNQERPPSLLRLVP